MSEEFNPHQYQVEAFNLMVKNPQHGIFMQPGLGKTPTSLMLLKHFRKKVLVIAPLLISHLVWPNEIKKWNQFKSIKCTILHGPDREKKFLSRKAGIYLINPESLLWLESMIIKHNKNPWEILIIDESTKFKAPNSKRFKVIKRMISMFKRRYILAGNPMPNSYLDLWSQIFILDKGKRLGPSYSAYKRRYFIQTGFRGFNWELKEGAAIQIENKLKDLCFFVEAKDYINLPKMIINDITFPLPPKIKVLYNKMEKKLFAELDQYNTEDLNGDEYFIDNGGKEIANTKVQALMKCQQIVQGFIYIHKEVENHKREKINKHIGTTFLHQIKLDLLKEIIEELNGKPILIGFWFGEDRERLLKAFPSAKLIGSGSTLEENKEIEKKWNKGKIPVLIGNFSSISHGLNLQFAGNNIAFYSMIYNYDQYDQFIKRVLRQGNCNEHIFVHRFLAENTIDYAMLDSINKKGLTSYNFLISLKKYKVNKTMGK